ncbi:MAG: hypothetical protein JWN56_533 [Sphingobacteriales bacterium]|nr:hypothetical protein [Sphingobacteriales bacterium]
MSKIVYVCYRNAELLPTIKAGIAHASTRILPDNISPNKTKVIEKEGVIYAIFNPVDSIIEADGNVLLGGIYGNDKEWGKLEQPIPDGSFALFRGNDTSIEVASDAAGSRSVWYYNDDELFIASTSQRAIVCVIGNFQLNKNVLPWILSTGSLGPSNSWDSRIKLLPPDSSALLNRFSWEVNVKSQTIKFNPTVASDDQYEDSLMKSLLKTFRGLNIDFTKWILPLSGGYDSRGILCLLNKIGANLNKLTAVTWGLNQSLTEVSNDAYVAKKLADYFEMPHKYYSTDLSDESIETIFNRFIICGEGRIDHIGGYLDGFRIWKTLFEDNVEGIIRGDVSFSEKPAISYDSIRSLQGMALCEEYANLENYESYGIPKQVIPAHLAPQSGESITALRDRLYHQFRIPTILASLNDLKLSYVEILNPLLSREVLYTTRQLPDTLRSGKVLFKKIVNSLSPDVEYATQGANAEKKTVFQSIAVVNFLKKELTSKNQQTIFSDEFIDYVLSSLKVNENIVKGNKTFKQRLIKYTPHWLLRNRARLGVPKSNVDFNVLAFRVYMAIKMNQLLHEDANELKLEDNYSV